MKKRIGDIAKEAGVSVETIRFYEREGLIEQPGKPPRGWRVYGGAVAAQLALVRLARQAGLSLADIKRLRRAAGETQVRFCAETRETVTARLAGVEAEIAVLETRRAALQDWLAHCATQPHAAICPLYQQASALVTKSGKSFA